LIIYNIDDFMAWPADY